MSAISDPVTVAICKSGHIILEFFNILPFFSVKWSVIISNKISMQRVVSRVAEQVS